MKGTLTEIEQYIVKSLVRNLKTISNSVRVQYILADLVYLAGKGGENQWPGAGGLIFEILPRVQQIWYNCSSRF